MAHFYGFKRLAKPEDWRSITSTPDFVAHHSAYELAHAWQAAGGIPEGITRALDAANVAVLSKLTLDVAIVEKPVFVDTKAAPSMTDLMAYGHNRDDDPVVIAVEAKGQEPFGLPVHAWLRGDVPESANRQPHPARERRFEFLCERLGFGVDLECGLRYQFLHRTVSAVLEGELHAAAAVLVLIHAFGQSAPGDWKDYELFMEALGFGSVVPGQVSGPAQLGSRKSMPTYFLWWQDTPRGQTA